VTVQSATEIAGTIPDSVVADILRVCSPKSTYSVIARNAEDIVAEGYSITQLLVQLHDVIIKSEEMSDKSKIGIVEVLARVDKELGDGADEELQLLSICLGIWDVMKKDNQ